MKISTDYKALFLFLLVVLGKKKEYEVIYKEKNPWAHLINNCCDHVGGFFYYSTTVFGFGCSVLLFSAYALHKIYNYLASQSATFEQL